MIAQNHILKMDPKPFRDVWLGYKTEEIHREDPDNLFVTGDTLTLEETLFDGGTMQWGSDSFPLIYTGRRMVVRVRHVVRRPYVRPGYAMLSIVVESKEDNSSTTLPGYLRPRLLSLKDPVLIRAPRSETCPGSRQRTPADPSCPLVKIAGVRRVPESLHEFIRGPLASSYDVGATEAPEKPLFPAGRHYLHKSPEDALGASSLYGAPIYKPWTVPMYRGQVRIGSVQIWANSEVQAFINAHRMFKGKFKTFPPLGTSIKFKMVPGLISEMDTETLLDWRVNHVDETGKHIEYLDGLKARTKEEAERNGVIVSMFQKTYKPGHRFYAWDERTRDLDSSCGD